MRFTDTHSLPCLDDSDYAGIALYMQCLASQLDAQLGAQQIALDSFLRRPAGIWSATTVQTGINDGSFINFFTPAPISANWPTVTPSTPTIANVRGWWMVGMNVNLISSGVVTVNSQRKLNLEISPPPGSPPGTSSIFFNDLTWETNTGAGENLSAAGTVFFTGTTSTTLTPSGLSGTINHTNAVSLNTTLTPPPTAWAFYLGDTPEIEGTF
ncbi:MAG: hypothetical protein ACREIE_01435 [Nitrospiraceae bacterium]